MVTPPDSGERWVTRRMEEACAAADHAGPYVTLCLQCVRGSGRVSLPLSLAQRILAALEDAQSLQERFAIAAELRELRERLPK